MIVLNNIDMTGLNQGLRGLANLGIPMAKVVKKETGELIKTLVKLSPPKERSRAQFNMETDVRSRFAYAATGGERDFAATSGSMGTQGLKWYAVDEHYLRGVGPELDLRKESSEAIYKKFRNLTRKGRVVVGFKHPRKRQKILISQKWVATKQQISSVVARIKRNYGRLKAGWMSAVRDGKIILSAGNPPPLWVKKHLNAGTRGWSKDETNSRDKPAFTIANTAKGVSSHTVRSVVELALKVRAKAMADNAATYFKGKKHLADYARV